MGSKSSNSSTLLLELEYKELLEAGVFVAGLIPCSNKLSDLAPQLILYHSKIRNLLVDCLQPLAGPISIPEH